ncbi:MAG TPA: DNA polymerase III subunit alpha [Chitinophaga sp.]|uniref:DNA polymerase III subunit alpha n=1 Tax=Chitinophaga sp. TaxID=1869181 RepID=UPI002CB6254E|nr:DNA polymerase III subunit alpha [Chitinophaga sp.]HVI46809.1 DNA polymerase III subunit alpha [Chitinophaga sp.]
MLVNLHSYYSLRYGTIPLSELVTRLKEQGHHTAVLTDINNTSGTLDFIKDCQQQGFNGLTGVEFRDGDTVLYIGIARNNLGFREMNELLTNCNLEGNPLPQVAPAWDHVYVMYPFGSRDIDLLRDNEWIGVKPAQLTKLYLAPKSWLSRMIMWWPVTFLEKKDFRLHCQLRAIDNNTLLSKLTQSQAAQRMEVLPSPGELVTAFSAFPELVTNTMNLLKDCHFDFDFSIPKNKQIFTDSIYSDKQLLEMLAIQGCRNRYGAGNKAAMDRVLHELDIINRMSFACYFLEAHDMVRHTMSQGIAHVGRGSGANSVVAYCLHITDVCPIELDLYFERFLNPKRKTPPDFDIDYSWKDRDMVFEYLIKRHGQRHTALLGMMSTLKDRSIIREIGKIYGLPKSEIDALVAGRSAGKANNQIARDVIEVYNSLPEDFPNSRSIHAGGVLITQEPITSFVALDLPPKGFATTQLDMYTAEDAGLYKLDVLSQRGLGHIKEATKIIRNNKGITVDVNDITTIKQDPKVKDKLRAADTIGCFYIESPAMQGVLTKLRCLDYLTLVAASSIIRPGVGSSGMMREYISRFHNPSKFTYLHPVLEEQLKETYGVMIYQEDVLKIGHHYGGLDMADADVLRRLMSGKTRGSHHLPAIQEKFFTHARNMGYPEATTQEVWRMIASFAGYSFSKAHSASYAIESLQSLYLKAYYPLEFMVAVVNNEGGFYSRWVYVEMARKDGAAIHLPCVNNSEYRSTLHGTDLYLGLNMIAGLETSASEQIVTERRKHGCYRDMEDFILRTHIQLKQLLDLVRLGGLRFTGQDKKTLRWQAYLLFKKHDEKMIAMGSLFDEPAKTIALPSFPVYEAEDFYDEIELLGFCVSQNAFDMTDEPADLSNHEILAADLLNHIGRQVTVTGIYVTTKPVRTKKGEVMAFATFLDRRRDFIHTVHFPASLAAYPIRGGGVYRIWGQVDEEFGFATLNVHRLKRLPIKGNPKFMDTVPIMPIEPVDE